MPRWGHLDIGTGIGDAQAYNPMPLVQEYAQTLAKNQAKHQQEVQMLGDQLAKGYDPTGLRNDADKQSYIQRYNQIKQDAINAENEKDNTKKALALSGVRQRLNDLSAFSAGSKKQGVFERQIALQHLNNPYLLDDNSANALSEQLKKPWDDPSVIKDASGFERGVDPEKIETKYQKHRADVLKDSQVTYDNGVITQNPKTIDGKKLFTVEQKRLVPMDGDNGAFESTLHWATADKDYQKFLAQKFPDVKADDNQHTLALRVKADMLSRGDKEGFYDKPKTRDLEGQAPDNFYKHYDYEVKHPKPNSTNTPNATAIIAENMRNSDPAKFTSLLKNTLPKAQFTPGQDIQATAEVDANGQPLHVFKFPDKVEIDNKAKEHNKAIQNQYNKNPEKKGGVLGFGGTPVPYENSDFYKKQVAKGNIQPEKKVVKDNSQPYKIPTGDPQSYAIGVASMLKEQGASDSEINKMLGKSGVHPVHLGDKPKAAAKPTSTPTGQMIRVKLPNGSVGEIPASKLNDFKKDYPGAEKID